MPAAAVIPAPIAYIKVVAVKKLVVGFWACVGYRLLVGWRVRAFLLGIPMAVRAVVGGSRAVYFEKIRVFKAGITSLNTLAWNNGIGLWFYFVGF